MHFSGEFPITAETKSGYYRSAPQPSRSFLLYMNSCEFSPVASPFEFGDRESALRALAQYEQICMWCAEGEDDCGAGEACKQANLQCVTACEAAAHFIGGGDAADGEISREQTGTWVAICQDCADLCVEHFNGGKVHAVGENSCREFRANCARIVGRLSHDRLSSGKLQVAA